MHTTPPVWHRTTGTGQQLPSLFDVHLLGLTTDRGHPKAPLALPQWARILCDFSDHFPRSRVVLEAHVD